MKSKRTFQALQALAATYPDLRPGQILQLVKDGPIDPFYWTDDEWIKAIEKAYSNPAANPPLLYD